MFKKAKESIRDRIRGRPNTPGEQRVHSCTVSLLCVFNSYGEVVIFLFEVVYKTETRLERKNNNRKWFIHPSDQRLQLQYHLEFLTPLAVGALVSFGLAVVTVGHGGDLWGGAGATTVFLFHWG